MLIQSMRNKKSTSNNDLSSLLNDIFVDEHEGYCIPIKINQYEQLWTPNFPYVRFVYGPQTILSQTQGQVLGVKNLILSIRTNNSKINGVLIKIKYPN